LKEIDAVGPVETKSFEYLNEIFYKETIWMSYKIFLYINWIDLDLIKYLAILKQSSRLVASSNSYKRFIRPISVGKL
jgi:hypothetical protein